MVHRIFVEKKPGFDVKAQQLCTELRTILGIGGLASLRLINRYDVEGISRELFDACVHTVFSEPQSDIATEKLDRDGAAAVFGVEYLPGQFDQRAESAGECIQLISQGERPQVRSAQVYLLYGDLSDDDIAAIKRYLINPIEAREASLEERETLAMAYAQPAPVEVLEGFDNLDEQGLSGFLVDRGLAMDLADLRFCQEYFRKEGRPPTITEIKMIDTYWSDHCRHTTFGTQLEDIQIDDVLVRAAFERYLAMRRELGRE
ncbi:MAG: phosphoribosylformylglycinamidine synthase, partial [Coriobacteriales bacterium]|nr:phosphoribosylformylglycinamidine synthase [Coriobacteriales bacterium]